MEEWREIPSLPRYKVSNKGTVQGPKKILKPCQNGDGYWLVCVFNSNIKRNETRYIHRLIAEAFIPIDNPSLYQVHHKDHNILNNSIENLEWMNYLEHRTYHLNNINIEILINIVIDRIHKYPIDEQKRLLKQFTQLI